MVSLAGSKCGKGKVNESPYLLMVSFVRFPRFKSILVAAHHHFSLVEAWSETLLALQIREHCWVL